MRKGTPGSQTHGTSSKAQTWATQSFKELHQQLSTCKADKNREGWHKNIWNIPFQPSSFSHAETEALSLVKNPKDSCVLQTLRLNHFHQSFKQLSGLQQNWRLQTLAYPCGKSSSSSFQGLKECRETWAALTRVLRGCWLVVFHGPRANGWLWKSCPLMDVGFSTAWHEECRGCILQLLL